MYYDYCICLFMFLPFSDLSMHQFIPTLDACSVFRNKIGERKAIDYAHFNITAAWLHIHKCQNNKSQIHGGPT